MCETYFQLVLPGPTDKSQWHIILPCFPLDTLRLTHVLVMLPLPTHLGYFGLWLRAKNFPVLELLFRRTNCPSIVVCTAPLLCGQSWMIFNGYASMKRYAVIDSQSQQ